MSELGQRRHAVRRAEKAERLRELLDRTHPDPPIPLDHESPFQLLVAVVLSAQTTDAMVNAVTPDLFAVAPDATAMARREPEEILPLIRRIGLAPTKARNLARMARLLVERHGGEVPATFEELEALPGVGHKSASVVMAQAFGEPAFPVDTHVFRLAKRWGLTRGTTVERAERDLKALFPRDAWRRVHLQMVFFGRSHCPARAHDMDACPACSWAASKKAKAAEAMRTRKGSAPARATKKGSDPFSARGAGTGKGV